MAFKTAAELFGDGGGFGVQVPIDVGAPTGPYAATNRGIGFGEQLSSAIANRTHYALGLNDDDLNTRLALWETTGLDAAYRGGASASPGIGADITLDGKAINTVSALATMYALDESNAHLRADMLLDVAKVGTGLEVRGRGLAGVLHLEQLDNLNTSSAFTGVNLAAVLNPGGALATTVRITGQSPHIGSATDLILESDFALVTTGGVSKLCIIGGLGAVDTDLTLKYVDGTGPVFGMNAVAVVTLYRPHFGSFTGLATRTGLRGTRMASGLRAVSSSVLDLLAGYSDSDPTMTDIALRVLRREVDGSTTAMLTETSLGRATRQQSVSGFSTSAGTSAGATQGVATVVVEDDPVAADETKYFTLDWNKGRRGSLALGGYGRHLSVKSARLFAGLAGTFFDADHIDLTVSMSPFQTSFLPLGATIVEITAASNPAAIGFYLLTAHDEPNDRFLIKSLTGYMAVSFVGVTCTMTMHVMNEAGVQGGYDVTGPGIVVPAHTTVADYTFLGSNLTYNKVLRGLYPVVIRDTDFELWCNATVSGPEGIKKIMAVACGSANPDVRISSALRVGKEISSGNATATGFRHIDATTGSTATPTVVHSIGFANALPDYFGGALEWVFSSRSTASPGPLKSVADASQVAIPVRVPHGAKLVSVDVTIKMGATRAAAGNRTTARLYLNDIDTVATTQLGADAVAANNTAVQVLSIANTSTIDTSDDELFVVVTAGTDGGHIADTLIGVRVTFEDPGPRNF